MRILCIGDSNTYGYDPRSYIGDRYPAEVRWTDRLTESGAINTGKSDALEVINAGINGMTVLRGCSVFPGRVRRTEPDLVIVMLGTNDLLVGTEADDIAERMDGLLAAITETGVPVLLISPPLLQYGEWVDGSSMEESELLGPLYRELAEQYGCQFADAGEWDIDVTFDGVHFSPEGHAKFAQKLEEIISC